jgi:cytochrome c-type biogenesis protein CcmH/NrfG
VATAYPLERSNEQLKSESDSDRSNEQLQPSDRQLKRDMVKRSIIEQQVESSQQQQVERIQSNRIPANQSSTRIPTVTRQSSIIPIATVQQINSSKMAKLKGTIDTSHVH